MADLRAGLTERILRPMPGWVEDFDGAAGRCTSLADLKQLIADAASALGLTISRCSITGASTGHPAG